MREFYELANEYPWTTIILGIAILIALDIIVGGLKKK